MHSQKQMSITISTTAKPTRNIFLLGLTKKEAIPNFHIQNSSLTTFYLVPAGAEELSSCKEPSTVANSAPETLASQPNEQKCEAARHPKLKNRKNAEQAP